MELEKLGKVPGFNLTVDAPRHLLGCRRPLLCLAHVMVAGRSIVLTDEPASDLVPETDARISEILRTALKDKTVQTNANRQESLENQDRIVEMQNGRIKELSNL